jgi:hypothetical protein
MTLHLKATGSDPVPATTFVITRSPSRSNHRDGLTFSGGTTGPIVYITGAAVGRWPSRGVTSSVLLEKPFAPAQVVTAVSQLLNTNTPTSQTTS